MPRALSAGSYHHTLKVLPSAKADPVPNAAVAASASASFAQSFHVFLLLGPLLSYKTGARPCRIRISSDAGPCGPCRMGCVARSATAPIASHVPRQSSPEAASRSCMPAMNSRFRAQAAGREPDRRIPQIRREIAIPAPPIPGSMSLSPLEAENVYGLCPNWFSSQLATRFTLF